MDVYILVCFVHCFACVYSRIENVRTRKRRSTRQSDYKKKFESSREVVEQNLEELEHWMYEEITEKHVYMAEDLDMVCFEKVIVVCSRIMNWIYSLFSINNVKFIRMILCDVIRLIPDSRASFFHKLAGQSGFFAQALYAAVCYRRRELYPRQKTSDCFAS
jgi:hypothetical protein